MFIATVIVSALLAFALLGSAGGKLSKQEAVLTTMRAVDFPLDKLWLLALAEIAGAIGLVVGLFWAPIGIAAAVGVILYFVGALVYHVRAHEKAIAPASVLLLLAVVALVLRAATT